MFCGGWPGRDISLPSPQLGFYAGKLFAGTREGLRECGSDSEAGAKPLCGPPPPASICAASPNSSVPVPHILDPHCLMALSLLSASL